MSSSTVEHFSHPKHPLVLKQDVVIGADATCSVCSQPVLGSPTYTCSSGYIRCRKFYLHKSCAELPKQIIREKQDPHPLALLPRPESRFCTCDACGSGVQFAYACDDCNIDICVVCAFISCFVPEEREIHHQGHGEHKLTLQREAMFKCDACYEEAKDHSYVCFTCDFWIHKKCALSPPIIPAPSYHHHPLSLIFSIPLMHRYFGRYCPICGKRVLPFCWSYYCHKCTFFVHMKCSTSTISLVNEIEENGIVDDEPDLVQFPLPGEESLFDLIITQCSKFQVEIQAEGENSANISTMPSDPHIIEQHWSHWGHPLELHQFTVGVNDNEDGDNNDGDDDDKRALICDGCIQPITISHPSYYACIECSFFLHSFCANKLPYELPVGASPFHPQHPLSLCLQRKFYSFVTCGICRYSTNGFYYLCKTCDIRFDIRCVFLPARIRHKSHKHHCLVQSPPSISNTVTVCSVSKFRITDRLQLKYACETCPNFQIYILCAFYPSRMKHRYDDHSLILRHPPFFYEGVFYCQLCEEQVNNQWWLYHCAECDQSFHEDCLRWYENVKLGGTVKHSIDNQPHTLALVIKKTRRNSSPPYLCGICGDDYKDMYFFECGGCGFLACIFCIRRIHGE